MRLADLQPGQRFRQPSIGCEGRLIALSPAAATVEIDRVTAAFTTHSERTTWSLATEVEPR